MPTAGRYPGAATGQDRTRSGYPEASEPSYAPSSCPRPLEMIHSFAGGRIFGARYGSGPPSVLALHGWAHTHKDFDGVLGGHDPLDAVAVDLPGFGASPPPPEGWGTLEYAEALVPLLLDLREESGGPPVVLGHSFGGKVATRLAAHWPQLVRALVLTGAPLARPEGGAGRRSPAPLGLAKLARRMGVLPEAAVDRLRERYGSPDYRAAQGVMRDVLVRTVNENYTTELSMLELPVSLVWGELDDAVPVAVARSLAQRLPSAQLVVLPGVGHQVPTDDPGALRGALEKAFG